MPGKSEATGFFFGFTMLARAPGRMREIGGLYKLAFIPIVLMAALILSLVIAVLAWTDRLLVCIWAGSEQLWWGFYGLLWLVAALAFFVLGYILLMMLAPTIGAPFYDKLSERVELALKGSLPQAPGSLAGDWFRAVSHALLSLGLFVLLMIPTLLLHLIPVIGSIVSMGLSAILAAFFLSLEFTDSAASRRRMSYGAKLGFAKRHRWAYLGFGVGVSLLMAIPFGNLLVLPFAVVGGTELFLELKEKGASGPTP